MISQSENLNTLWANLVVEECVRNGPDFFCISPGSRSTPLTVAAARNPKAKTTICYDERGAAFMALGYARATQKPAVLVCTSGTAVANYLPAVVEASNDDVPMLLCTADRPPELQNTGANQTIDQQHIYGEFVRWEFNFEPPNEYFSANQLLSKVNFAIQQAVNKAGPVHLNFMFREPLEPQNGPVPPDYLMPAKEWQKSNLPFAINSPNKKILDWSVIERILSNAKNGLLVVGRLHSERDIQSVERIAKKFSWPMFADISSNLRVGRFLENRISYFDQVLLSQIAPPDVVLHLGGRITSKRFVQFVEANKNVDYIHINSSATVIDPAHAIKHKLVADFFEFEKAIQNWDFNPGSNLHVLKKQDKKIENVLTKNFSINELSESLIIRTISQIIEPDSGLFLSNSMPVRDMDMYADPDGPVVRIGTNRGASGIDGIMATSVGFANGLQKTVTCIIGDLAALHDLNSLWLVKNSQIPIIIVLINNHGGGIFHFLPISKYDQVFSYFETPHNLGFEHAAKMFGIPYHNPKSLKEFEQIYKTASHQPNSILIEIETDKKQNFEFHKELQKEILERLKSD